MGILALVPGLPSGRTSATNIPVTFTPFFCSGNYRDIFRRPATSYLPKKSIVAVLTFWNELWWMPPYADWVTYDATHPSGWCDPGSFLPNWFWLLSSIQPTKLLNALSRTAITFLAMTSAPTTNRAETSKHIHLPNQESLSVQHAVMPPRTLAEAAASPCVIERYRTVLQLQRKCFEEERGLWELERQRLNDYISTLETSLTWFQVVSSSHVLSLIEWITGARIPSINM